MGLRYRYGSPRPPVRSHDHLVMTTGECDLWSSEWTRFGNSRIHFTLATAIARASATSCARMHSPIYHPTTFRL